MKPDVLWCERVRIQFYMSPVDDTGSMRLPYVLYFTPAWLQRLFISGALGFNGLHNLSAVNLQTPPRFAPLSHQKRAVKNEASVMKKRIRFICSLLHLLYAPGRACEHRKMMSGTSIRHTLSLWWSHWKCLSCCWYCRPKKLWSKCLNGVLVRKKAETQRLRRQDKSEVAIEAGGQWEAGGLRIGWREFINGKDIKGCRKIVGFNV